MTLRQRIATLSISGTLLPLLVKAQDGFVDRIRGGANQVAKPSGLNANGDPALLVGTVIRAALSLVGVILLLILLYSGFLWMTAGGNEKQVTEARQRILQAVVGLVIIASAYAITTFVLTQLAGVTTGATVQ